MQHATGHLIRVREVEIIAFRSIVENQVRNTSAADGDLSALTARAGPKDIKRPGFTYWRAQY